jgi:hypothetical protein
VFEPASQTHFPVEKLMMRVEYKYSFYFINLQLDELDELHKLVEIFRSKFGMK